MTEEEMEGFMAALEVHLEGHLRPVKPGVGHWGKAMKLIRDAIKLQVEKAMETEADRNRDAIEMAYSNGYQAGQGLKG